MSVEILPFDLERYPTGELLALGGGDPHHDPVLAGRLLILRLNVYGFLSTRRLTHTDL